MKCLLPVICLVADLALSGCGGTAEMTDAKALATAYAEEFGVSPPAGVADLQARHVVVGDSFGAWLRFVADPATFDGSVAKRFTPCGYGDFIARVDRSPNTPAWWRPIANATTKFYYCSHWRDPKSYSEAVIAYDRAEHIVYFHHGMSY